jgi:hypothetical protein
MKTLLIITGLLMSKLFLGQQPQKNFISVQFEDMYSTHDDYFKGVSISANKMINQRISIGFGTEYAATPFHGDNGWNLYTLRFVPVFADQRFHLNSSKKLTEYFHLEEGLTFAWYKKEWQASPGTIYPVSERGFYGYAGGGLRYRITGKILLTGEAGMKGFHLSFNSLDVNPHGLTGKIGLLFFLKK